MKEANILVREADGQPVLVDFGAAGGEGLGGRVTRGRMPPGTPHYRSPEAWQWLRQYAAVPGVSGIITTGLLGKEGVAARQLVDIKPQPPVAVQEGWSYRALGVSQCGVGQAYSPDVARAVRLARAGA
ncbi:MAG TPA: hypothetical protein VK539_01865 [Myxococcaceae bacterium]|nr:hypothetical protein [Myxococcaceae bacterium]